MVLAYILMFNLIRVFGNILFHQINIHPGHTYLVFVDAVNFIEKMKGQQGRSCFFAQAAKLRVIGIRRAVEKKLVIKLNKQTGKITCI